jgi:hypothetical protein
VDNRYKIEYRITYSSILLKLQSIHFPQSFPANIMHYMLLNITPFLYHLWNGTKFKIDNPKTKNDYMDKFPELPFYYLSDTELKTINSVLAKLRS